MKNLFFSAYKKVFSYITSIVIFMVSLPYAYSQDVVVNTTKHLFTVKIGTTRVIYPSSSTKGVSVSVANPQDYPILVQTQVKDEDKTSPAPFIVTLLYSGLMLGYKAVYVLFGPVENSLKIVKHCNGCA